MASKTQEKSIDIIRKACYNINGEHRWRLLPYETNNRLQLETRGGYFSLFAVIEVIKQQVGKHDKCAYNH